MNPPAADFAKRNQRTALFAFLIVVAMVGLAYASVPLYRLFCQATGFNGTTQRASGAVAEKPVPGKSVSIRFDANVAPSLPWRFQPERETHVVRIGERNMAIYLARNLSARPITGRAVFNVSPPQAGKYFTKIQCFCFTQQVLKPGEEARMPVIFYVDPKFVKDPDTSGISEITLSYTFYPVDQAGSGS
ncbi:MAG: cytochrome c oxidase assembly protein subunit 11 [Sphingomonadales bacterium]|nr:cytochrome c oxidase assembly protein subunit 11 [Sphingomonadales bacterium]